MLEAVGTYLHGKDNWVYGLISNLPDTVVVIAAKNFLDCDFYTNDLEYLKFPLQKVTPKNKTLATGGFGDKKRGGPVDAPSGSVSHVGIQRRALPIPGEIPRCRCWDRRTTNPRALSVC
jgi:hypothetical protein